MGIIKSVYETDTEILNGISNLYLQGNEFDLDPTYSKGVFYKTFKEPNLKSDLMPQVEGVIQSDCRKLWLNENSINSICFDPPFLFRNRPSVNNDVNCNRFSYFKTYKELLLMYEYSLLEFYRVLNKKGIVAFKCQDMTDDKLYLTHCDMMNFIARCGFKAIDLFILVAKNRIYHSETIQRHARKFHSYWYVLQTIKK